MNDMKMRFAKLMSTMGNAKVQVNPGIDDQATANFEKEKQLALIDDKIAQLENSQDPHSLDSLNFWKQQRHKLSAD